MADQPTQPPAGGDRYKAEMPAIPGVGPGAKQSSPAAAPLKIVGGLIAVLVVIVGIGVYVSRTRRHATPPPDPLPQVEVPQPDLGSAPTQAPPPMRGIATTDAMAKPWSSAEFEFRDPLTGARSPAMLVRLPGGSASLPSGYWAFSLKSAYGNCQLEYVSDLEKLRTEYGYHAAKHPMVGNPCSHTVFDPTRMTNIPGNIFVRGAIAQGSDLRPPFGIEIKIEGKDIFSVRGE